MTFTRGAEGAGGRAGESGISSRVPHDEQDGHFPVLVVVMCPHSEQIYFVILVFAIIWNHTIRVQMMGMFLRFCV